MLEWLQTKPRLASRMSDETPAAASPSHLIFHARAAKPKSAASRALFVSTSVGRTFEQELESLNLVDGVRHKFPILLAWLWAWAPHAGTTLRKLQNGVLMEVWDHSVAANKGMKKVSHGMRLEKSIVDSSRNIGMVSMISDLPCSVIDALLSTEWLQPKAVWCKKSWRYFHSKTMVMALVSAVRHTKHQGCHRSSRRWDHSDVSGPRRSNGIERWYGCECASS